jgi:YjjW family glycine radical enzyme activase
MSSLRGLVADTLEFSAVDGPGNRFVVFLQGCTFDCLACHNPYTINPCVDCGECVDQCPSGALTLTPSGVVSWNPDECLQGDHCHAVCRYASSPKARHLAVADLIERIRPAAPFLSGVTVSGGEATMQPHFLRALFDGIKADPTLRTLTCFVDTNGDAPSSTWSLLDPVLDGAMVDLKCLDPAIHVEITGADNTRTLDSIVRLAQDGKLYEVRLLILPGRNDDPELLTATGAWLADIDPRLRIKVIGFRRHGTRPSPIPLVEPTREHLQRCADLVAARGDFVVTVV